ncbi:MAG: hypothetical protein ACI8UO_005513 [Verrucomicrobiales bacterium]|jgi:hypothetical protein
MENNNTSDSSLPSPYQLAMIAAQFYKPVHSELAEDIPNPDRENLWEPTTEPSDAAFAAYGLWKACATRINLEAKCPWPADLRRPEPKEYPMAYESLLEVIPDIAQANRTKRNYLEIFLNGRPYSELEPDNTERPKPKDKGIFHERDWLNLAAEFRAWAPEHKKRMASERGKKGAKVVKAKKARKK